jgi:hypothetical protein
MVSNGLNPPLSRWLEARLGLPFSVSASGRQIGIDAVRSERNSRDTPTKHLSAAGAFAQFDSAFRSRGIAMFSHQRGHLAAWSAAAVWLGVCSSAQAQVELVTNGGFETGDLSGWASDKFDNTNLAGGWTINDGTLWLSEFAAPTPPISGRYDAVSFQFAGGWRTLTSAPIVVPDNVSLALVSWSDRIRNWDLFHSTFAPGQRFRVEILDANLAPIGSAPVYSTVDGDPKVQYGPNHRAFDVTGLLQGMAGQQIHIRFEQDDLNFLFNVNVDNVSLLVEMTEPEPDPDPEPEPEPEPEGPIEVVLDVKPGSDVNPINLKVNSKAKGKSDAAGGVVPVAVLTTLDFDAARVDVTRVVLGDPLLPGFAFPIRGGLEDVDLDGDLDLMLHFSIQNMVSVGAINQQTTSLSLTGFALDGADLRGIDNVQIEPVQTTKQTKSAPAPAPVPAPEPPPDTGKNNKKQHKK